MTLNQLNSFSIVIVWISTRKSSSENHNQLIIKKIQVGDYKPGSNY